MFTVEDPIWVLMTTLLVTLESAIVLVHQSLVKGQKKDLTTFISGAIEDTRG